MQRQYGFTLLELLCVLSIISAVGILGAARFIWVQQQQTAKQTLQDDLKNLASGLQQARQLAISSGHSSYICGGENCSGNWSDGFRVVQSDSAGGLFRQVVFDHDVQIRWHGFPVYKKRIDFFPNGLGSYQNGTFVLCYQSFQASVILNQSGRYYVLSPIRTDEETC